MTEMQNENHKVEWRIDPALEEVKAELMLEVEAFAKKDRYVGGDSNGVEIYRIFEIEVRIGFMKQPYVYVWTRVVNKQFYWSLQKDRCVHKSFTTKSTHVAMMDQSIDYIIDIKEM
jgi:hypothetical protein